MIHVESGPRIVLRAVKIDGNAPGSLADARTRLGFAAGQPYDRPHIVARLAEYVRELRGRGYYEAVADHSLGNMSADKRTADLLVTIDGGPHVTVVFEGEPVPARVRDDLVPIAREGAVDEDLLEDSSRRDRRVVPGTGLSRCGGDAHPDREERRAGDRLSRRARALPTPWAPSRSPAISRSRQPICSCAMHMTDGEPFVQARLDGDINAIMDRYRRLGFTGVQDRARVVELPADRRLSRRASTLQIDEGPRTLVGRDRRSQGITRSPSEQLRTAARLEGRGAVLSAPARAGSRFAAADVPESRLSHGGRLGHAGVHRRSHDGWMSPSVSVKGQQVFVDHVLIIGNEKTGADTIRREVVLKSGDPLGFDAISESQRQGQRAGAVQARAHHGARSRRRYPPRPSRDGRGGAGDVGRLRRRRRGRPAPASAPLSTRRRASASSSRRAASSRSAGATCGAAIDRSTCSPG